MKRKKSHIGDVDVHTCSDLRAVPSLRHLLILVENELAAVGDKLQV